jgi:heptosyltransferase-2
MRRVLVIRGGAIGDVILTLPAVGALRLAFPSARIDVMGDAKRVRLAWHPDYADAIADAEQWEIYRLFSRAPQVPPRLAAYLSACELILSYLPTPDAIFADNLRRYCPGEVIAWPPHPRTGVHATDHLLQPVLRFLDRAPPAQPRFYPSAAHQQAANHFWRSAGLPEQGVLAVHPGSGGRHKLWPSEGWRQVMAWAAEEGIPGVVICGPAEEERCVGRLLTTLSPSWKVLRTASLPELAAILARCAVFAGHDSGITHLAAAVGTRTLALFGPTDPQMWGPRSERACVIQPAPPGPLGLNSLPAEAVIWALRAMLDGTFQFNPSGLGAHPLASPGLDHPVLTQLVDFVRAVTHHLSQNLGVVLAQQRRRGNLDR